MNEKQSERHSYITGLLFVLKNKLRTHSIRDRLVLKQAIEETLEEEGY